jgi:hypothetical protein
LRYSIDVLKARIEKIAFIPSSDRETSGLKILLEMCRAERSEVRREERGEERGARRGERSEARREERGEERGEKKRRREG